MKLVRAGLVLGASTAVRLAANLVTIKIIALHLGTDGLGILGQLMSVMALAATIAGGGIGLGVTKLVSQQQARDQSPAPYLCAAGAIWLVASGALGALIALGARDLSELIFGTPVYAVVFWALAAGQVAMGAANLLTAVLSGRQDVAGVATIQTLTAVFGAALITGLVLAADLVGAMWAIVLAPALGVVFAAVRVVQKGYLQERWRGLQVNASHYKDLLGYSAMLAVTVCTMPLAQIVLRTWQVDAMGWQTAGIWQGLVKLSDAWLQLALVILSTWYFPRVAGATSHVALHREFRRTFIAFASILVPAAACIWLFRDPLVDLLFSPDFRPMVDLLAPQLVGDVLRTLAYVAGYIAVAKARTGLYVLAELFQVGMLLGLSHLLLPTLGERAVPLAYMFTNLAYCAICLAVYSRYHSNALRSATP